ncbi:MAG: cation:proton antiporter [Opitutaceae bacterium]|nr:cation:proton antiporter [Opitutaceae bacterium]
MAGIDLIQDFAILLLAAGLAGTLCKRLGLSIIVGYLVAGIIIGPHTPPFSLIVDETRIMALSRVGLVFLIFSIGLG